MIAVADPTPSRCSRRNNFSLATKPAFNPSELVLIVDRIPWKIGATQGPRNAYPATSTAPWQFAERSECQEAPCEASAMTIRAEMPSPSRPLSLFRQLLELPRRVRERVRERMRARASSSQSGRIDIPHKTPDAMIRTSPSSHPA